MTGSGAAADSVEPLNFVYDLPPISERQLAIVKLVAGHAVRDEQFARSRAAEFDFTHRGHGLYRLYTAYVRQYELVLQGARPPKGSVLARAAQRALHSQQNPPRAAEPGEPDQQAGPGLKPEGPRMDAAEPSSEKSLFAAVDWQDFVVLETVEFFSADLTGKSRLSAPLTREEAALHREQTSSRKRKPRHEPMYKSPYTGELVAASDFDEHMRVHSLDPSWRTQQQQKQQEPSANLDMKGAAENLARLQEKRRRLLEEQ